LRIDPELVRDLPILVPVLIDQSPLRLRVDLKEMPDDRVPLRRIQRDQLSTGSGDLFSDALVVFPQRSPATVPLTREVNVRLPWDDVRPLNQRTAGTRGTRGTRGIEN